MNTIFLSKLYGLYNLPALHPLRGALWSAKGWYFGSDIQEAVAKSKMTNAVLRILARCKIPAECRENNVLFIHIPRCGGLSISKVLYGHFRDHHTAAFFRKVDHEFFRSAFKFAVIRHPAARAISAYCHTLNKGSADIIFDRGWQLKTKHVKTFDDYIEFLEQNSWRLHQLDFVMRPQAYFISDDKGNVLIENLFRLEKDMGAVNSLLQSLGLPQAPHTNASRATEVRLTRRQSDRILALYAADLRMYEGLSQSKPF